MKKEKGQQKKTSEAKLKKKKEKEKKNIGFDAEGNEERNVM